MSKRTERMKAKAEEKIIRKDREIQWEDERLQECEKRYEELELSSEAREAVDDYIACKDSRNEKMESLLYKAGMRDAGKRIRRRRFLLRAGIVAGAVAGVVIWREKTLEKIQNIAEWSDENGI